jgi:hypothetical protein
MRFVLFFLFLDFALPISYLVFDVILIMRIVGFLLPFMSACMYFLRFGS